MLEKFYIFTLKYPGKESGPAFFVSLRALLFRGVAVRRT